MGKKNFKQARLRRQDIVCRLSCDHQTVLKRLGRQKMKGIVDTVQECGSARHEGVPKATEISAIAHFLGEDIGRVTFAADIFDGDGPVCNPLTGGLLSVLDMVITFGRQIVAPFYTCFVVIVKWCQLLGISDWVAKGGKMKNHIADVDSETGTHVGGANFGVTRAERSTLLMVRLPGDGTAGAEDDGIAHAAEFKKRELYTFTDCFTYLRAPACVTVCGETMVLGWTGWDGVVVCFGIRRVREGHVGV